MKRSNSFRRSSASRNSQLSTYWTIFHRQIKPDYIFQMYPLQLSWTKSMLWMFHHKLLNTLIPAYVDELVKHELNKRAFGDQTSEQIVEVREDLQNLFRSPLFPIGPSKIISKLRKRWGQAWTLKLNPFYQHQQISY